MPQSLCFSRVRHPLIDKDTVLSSAVWRCLPLPLRCVFAAIYAGGPAFVAAGGRWWAFHPHGLVFHPRGHTHIKVPMADSLI